MSQQQIWLISVPNAGGADGTLASLNRELSSVASLYRVDIPSLVVGTLDSLMAISDELVKTNSQIETVVKKIERQYSDLLGASGTEFLRVGNDLSVEAYLRTFQWDFARYRFQGRALPDLIGQVQSMAAKADEELKKLSLSYNEKNQNLASVQRKRTTNLNTSDLEDFLPAAAVNKHEFLNTENFLTVLVVVTGPTEQEFLRTYETFGADIAAFGGPDWNDYNKSKSLGTNDGKFGPEGNRESVKGSPVIPGSAFRLHTEGDNHLYGITILKGHSEAGYYDGDEFVAGKYVDYLDQVKHVFREKRFPLREFVFDASKAGGLETQLEHAKWELQQIHAAILRWCKAHYGEVFSGWMHLKVIRVFVESILRYGLPADFTAVILEPNMRRLSSVQAAVSGAVAKIRADLAVVEDEEGAEGAGDDDSLPYVCQKFYIAGSGKL